MTAQSLDMSIPVLHQTDLFRPYNDPDDHWDLACVYALALSGDIELKGTVIDFPPEHHRGDPDVLALAQMNYITGLQVPFVVGSPDSTASTNVKQAEAGYASRRIIATLESSASRVIINIVGSCHDIAEAAKRAPQLFRENCAGIYLNAGTGSRDATLAAELEYNVKLDPLAYQAIFDIPCPIYWLPCFEAITQPFRVSEFGSWYEFVQADILFSLSDRMQKYFAYALGRIEDPRWLDYLHQHIDQELLTKHAQKRRNMWCTAGFFHAAGKSVTCDGRIIPQEDADGESVFTFDPIEVQCDRDGVTSWSPTAQEPGRYILHVRDGANCRQAMTAAMKSLLATLP